LNDKLPWFFSLILAVIGWTITHIVDRVNETPALEYKISNEISSNFNNVEIEITNITRSTAFQNIIIVLQDVGDIRNYCGYEAKKIDEEFCPKITPVQPAEDGKEAPSVDERSVSFNIPRIMPGSVYRIKSPYVKTETPKIRISSNISTIKMTSRNIETVFAKNEIDILLILLSSWIIILSLILNRRYLSKIKKYYFG
jgi:hypothetical protein